MFHPTACVQRALQPACVLAWAATWGLVCAGCGSRLEKSADAVPLPGVAADALEVSEDGRAWPGFRGVNAAGISSSKNLPVRFSSADGVKWKVAVPGRGKSSPIVWNDSVVLTTAVAQDDGVRPAVLCYRRSDGRLAWRSELQNVTGSTHPKNGHASATPVTDGQRIYAFFGTAGLYCFDFNGNLCWQHPCRPLVHRWCTASSPVLYGDLVIQLCDQAEGSYCAAFDKLSGEVRWQTPRESIGGWTTPVLVEAVLEDGSRRMELLVNGTGTQPSQDGWVIAYDPASGRELWRVQGTKDIVCPTMIVSGELAISTSGRNGPIFALRPGGHGDVTATHVVWRQSHGGPYVPTGVAYRNRLYLVTDGGVMHCYNAGDGTLVWRKRLGGNFTASLVAGDGRVYALSERGTMYVLSAGDAYQLLAENDLGEPCFATPAIAEGELFLRTESHLICIPPQDPAGPLAEEVQREVLTTLGSSPSPSDDLQPMPSIPSTSALISTGTAARP